MEKDFNLKNILLIIAKIFNYLSLFIIFLLTITFILVPITLKNIKFNDNSFIIFNKEYKIRYFDKKIVLINGKKRINTKFTKEDKDKIYEINKKLDSNKIIFYLDVIVSIYIISYLFLFLIFKKINELLKNLNDKFFENKNLNLIKQIGIILIIYLILNIIINFINRKTLNDIPLDFSFYKYVYIYIIVLYLYLFNCSFNSYTKEKLCKK